MAVEQLIFAIISFALFIYMFYKIIKKNDTSYFIMIILQAIAIALNFFEFLFKVKLNLLFMIIKYVIGLLLPITIIILEKYNIPFTEIVDLTKADIFLRLKDSKKAKQALLHLLAKYPENYQGHKRLAEIYKKEGGSRKAIDEYVQAIDINKRDYDSYYKVAELLNNLDKKEEASQMLFNLLKKKPDYYEATILLGDILIEKEMYKEAVNIYQEALRYNPVSFDLNYNLGIVYTMLNDFENAKICYEKSAQINSLSYNSKYALAEIALIYKEIDEAQKYFMQVLEDEKLAPEGYYQLAKIELIKGNKDMAIQYANTAIDSNSKKIVDKIKKDPLFIPIIAKLSIPFNIDGQEVEENKDLLKEIKAKEHLEETFEITRNLGYSDIEMLNRNKIKKQQFNNIQSKTNENYREL